MTDAEILVKQLRACANGSGNFKSNKGDFGVCDDAADEIERLQARFVIDYMERETGVDFGDTIGRTDRNHILATASGDRHDGTPREQFRRMYDVEYLPEAARAFYGLIDNLPVTEADQLLGAMRDVLSRDGLHLEEITAALCECCDGRT